jgi:hypothetical protein
LPRKASQLTNGKFSCQGIPRSHPGQNERRGLFKLSPRGMRWMQAFKKDPTIAPSTKAKIPNGYSVVASIGMQSGEDTKEN